MPQLDNFFAWISIDDRPLQEYQVEYSDLLTVTCWIASEDGKPFKINWQDSVRSQASMGRTFVDGVKCGVPKGINRKGYKKDSAKENDTACQRGAPTPSGKEKQLVFSKVEYIGEEISCGQASSKIGEIRLEISSIQKRGQTALQINSFQADGKVDEMAKQMTPHCTRLGSFVNGDRKPIHLVKTIGKTRIFVFKYRPFEILMSLGVLPVQEHLVSGSSHRSKHCLDRDIQESQHQGNEIAKDVTIRSETQKIKKEAPMDLKIEEMQLKLDDDSMKTEIKFFKLPCNTEDEYIPNVKDPKLTDIIDLSMDD